jgi:hypothetical protein
MPTSQNGYPANNPALVSSRLVPGTTRKLTVRNGPAGDLLLWVAGQFDEFVEDIEQGILDDWGYAERPIRGSTTELSNHASGTAIDLNATAHPLATDPVRNFTRSEIDAIHAIIGRTQGCVRWGGDYTGRKDGMHFEINDGVSEARCAAVLKTLTQEDWLTMATPKEISDAVETGVFNALKRFVQSNEIRWDKHPDGSGGSNWADCVVATRNAAVDLQTKGGQTNDKLDRLNANVADLTAAVKGKSS